ncbi:MAG: hypothetical protein K2Y39_11075 [Candidatus Obscuribacterales bacterium]|nr:hypothetical protein [Candidatus Obscuribacterales bacterium]
MSSGARVESVVRGSLVLACSLLALTLVFFLPEGKSFADQGFNWYVNPGQRNLFAPRVAYAFFCALLCASAFALARCRSVWTKLGAVNAALRNTVVASVLLFCAASLFTYFRDLSIIPATVLIGSAAYLAWKKLPDRVTVSVALLLACTAFLIAVVPGLTAPPDYSAHYPEAIADIQSHQALSTAANVQLAHGAKLFDAVSARYGVLWQSLLAVWSKLVHPLTVGDTIMICRWMQTIFFALASVAYLEFARRKPLCACLAILFIAPWMELKQPLFVFPQVASWRYFGFAAVPLFVMYLERSGVSARCILLGVTAGIFLLSDFASGASITVGLLAYLLYRRQECSTLRCAFLYFAGLLLILAIFTAVFAVVFGYVPAASSVLSDLKNTLWEAAGGTAPDLGYPFDPLAILILVHTAYAGLSLASRGVNALSGRDALRLCLCVISLFWFVHYVNEPNTFALRACRVLYGFFIVDLVRILLAAIRAGKRTNVPAWLLTSILGCVILPAGVVSYQPAFDKAAAMLKSKSNGDRRKLLVSGVYLSEEVGSALLKKAEYIKNAAGDKPVFYLTADSSFVPTLSGKITAAPIGDPFSQLVFAKQSDKLVRKISDAGAKVVYVDDPDFVTSKGVGRRSCFDYLRVLIGRDFKLERTEDGWQVWVRKSDDALLKQHE